MGEESVAQYNFLQRWSAAYQTGEELSVDLFVRRLFGEVVARSYQPLRTPSDVAADFSRLQHAARRFVELGPEVFAGGSPASGARFLEMLSMRVTPAKADDDPSLSPGVVYLMPGHTFLTGDLTCDYQFWLDAGSPSLVGATRTPVGKLTYPLARLAVRPRMGCAGQEFGTDSCVGPCCSRAGRAGAEWRKHHRLRGRWQC